MAVEVDLTRKAVEIIWDTDLIKGHRVHIRAEHGDDVSVREDLVNDGRATLTFPAGYHGESFVRVFGAHGEDSGTITV